MPRSSAVTIMPSRNLTLSARAALVGSGSPVLRRRVVITLPLARWVAQPVAGDSRTTHSVDGSFLRSALADVAVPGAVAGLPGGDLEHGHEVSARPCSAVGRAGVRDQPGIEHLATLVAQELTTNRQFEMGAVE